MNKIIIHTDGGSRGNPGNAGIGIFMQEKNEKNEIVKTIKHKEYIGIATNNVAEYKAILWALSFCVENNYQNVECYLDSELVVKQLNGEYKVKDQTLGTFFIKIYNLRQKLRICKFAHVRREFNKEADLLVNAALDEKEGIL